MSRASVGLCWLPSPTIFEMHPFRVLPLLKLLAPLILRQGTSLARKIGMNRQAMKALHVI